MGRDVSGTDKVIEADPVHSFSVRDKMQGGVHVRTVVHTQRNGGQIIQRAAADLHQPRPLGRGIARIHRAREHLVVPDEEPELVAEVVEAVLLVLSAAPEPDHVHVRRGRAFQEIAIALRRLAVLVGVAGNPVRALREDALAVDGENLRTRQRNVQLVGLLQLHRFDMLGGRKSDVAHGRNNLLAVNVLTEEFKSIDESI